MSELVGDGREREREKEEREGRVREGKMVRWCRRRRRDEVRLVLASGLNLRIPVVACRSAHSVRNTSRNLRGRAPARPGECCEWKLVHLAPRGSRALQGCLASVAGVGRLG